MCPDCATFNYKKRIQTADLKGRIALMTGAASLIDVARPSARVVLIIPLCVYVRGQARESRSATRRRWSCSAAARS